MQWGAALSLLRIWLLDSLKYFLFFRKNIPVERHAASELSCGPAFQLLAQEYILIFAQEYLIKNISSGFGWNRPISKFQFLTLLESPRAAVAAASNGRWGPQVGPQWVHHCTVGAALRLFELRRLPAFQLLTHSPDAQLPVSYQSVSWSPN